MAWPSSGVAFGGRLDAAREIFAELAQTNARFEPVTMVTRPDLVAGVSLMCGNGVSIAPIMIDDSWTRDTAPTFTLDDNDTLSGVGWRFNGWGGVNPDHAEDAQLAGRIGERLDIEIRKSELVTEGGAIHVDGEGTALVCRPSILDPARNPDWDEAAVERELARQIGVEKVIWLPNSHIDDETAGHVDNLASFAKPGHVVALVCDDPGDPNHELLEENARVLAETSDARGRYLQVTRIAAPAPGYRDNGKRLTLSYINFYIANGAIIMPGFNDPADKPAYRTMQSLFANREIVQLQVRDLIHGGGGIHCVTQQQPWSRLDAD